VGGKVIEGLARFIFQQLIIALDFCHRKGKVNRDVKLSNILLSIAEGQLPLVKLCDFGVSKDTYRHSEPHSQACARSCGMGWSWVPCAEGIWIVRQSA
jgi:serine/threonine-protein kinase SRK2